MRKKYQVGSAVSAGIGVLTGVLSGIAQRKRLKKLEEQYNTKLLDSQEQYADSRTNPNYFGNRDTTIAQLGQALSSGGILLGGKYHSEGGTPMIFQGEPVEMEKGEVISNDYVFSRVLPNKAKNENFADMAKAFEKQKGKLEKSEKNNQATKNSIELINQQLELLKQKQEEFKAQFGLNNVEYIPQLEQDLDNNNDGINDIITMAKGGYLKDKNTYITKDGRETRRGLWANVYLKNKQGGGFGNFLLNNADAIGGLAQGVLSNVFPSKQEVDTMQNQVTNFQNPYQQQIANNYGGNPMMQIAGYGPYAGRQYHHPGINTGSNNAGFMDYARNALQEQARENKYNNPLFNLGVQEYIKKYGEHPSIGQGMGEDIYNYIIDLAKNPDIEYNSQPIQPIVPANVVAQQASMPINPKIDGRLTDAQIQAMIQEKGYNPRTTISYDPRTNMPKASSIESMSISSSGNISPDNIQMQQQVKLAPKKFKFARELGVDTTGLSKSEIREADRLSRRLLKDERKGKRLGDLNNLYAELLSKGNIDGAFDVYYDKSLRTGTQGAEEGYLREILAGKEFDPMSADYMDRGNMNQYAGQKLKKQMGVARTPLQRRLGMKAFGGNSLLFPFKKKV